MYTLLPQTTDLLENDTSEVTSYLLNQEINVMMDDFVQGRNLYNSVTEDILKKEELMNNADLSKVLTILGGGWPIFYHNKGANFIHAIDINVKQIAYFLDQLPLESTALNAKFESHKFIISLANATNLNGYLSTEYSQSTFIDLSNIFDYSSMAESIDTLKQVMTLMKKEAMLIVCSISPDRMDKLRCKLRDFGYKSYARYGKHYDDCGLIENFLLLQK